ncbi:hypothetical protein [Runella slithyformis]|uniref:hypothetical protein n=1 Tax=Runella slithyformis TaxID=106 RepID=UPI00030B6BDC|nr:hypothetical protein [Runella slithyformis]
MSTTLTGRLIQAIFKETGQNGCFPPSTLQGRLGIADRKTFVKPENRGLVLREPGCYYYPRLWYYHQSPI